MDTATLEHADALAPDCRAFPRLATDRLELREFAHDDGDAVFAIFSSEAMAAWHNIARMECRAEGYRLAAWRRAQWRSGRGVRWAIALRERPECAIGSCGFDFRRSEHGAVELSYDLHPEYWGAGLAREALTRAIDCAFDGALALPIERIEALTMPANLRSRRLLEALGFVHEGVLRRYRRWRDETADLACWSLLVGERRAR